MNGFNRIVLTKLRSRRWESYLTDEGKEISIKICLRVNQKPFPITFNFCHKIGKQANFNILSPDNNLIHLEHIGFESIILDYLKLVELSDQDFANIKKMDVFSEINNIFNFKNLKAQSHQFFH